MATMESQPTSGEKVVVVGIYGIPGSGKTFLLNLLKKGLGQEHFEFYEGSNMIANLVPGGLDGFKELEEDEKAGWRKLAIDIIKKECAISGKVAIVAGHFMFWAEDEKVGKPVYTPNDLNTFTHILYLEVAAELVAQRRLHDKTRNRPLASFEHLEKWQQAEKTELRNLCYGHSILFMVLSPHPKLLDQVTSLLHDIQYHTDDLNLLHAKNRLDEILSGHEQLETMVVMDADRTLIAEDTGALFWEKISSSQQSGQEENRLKTLFSSNLGYTYTAFRQATLLYEEVANNQEFDAFCDDVASMVAIHPEFLSLLHQIAEKEHVGAVIITCGLRCIWDKILERAGLSKKIQVIGGGRIADGFVVTAEVKAAMVVRMKHTHHVYVWAFGDSVLDLPMLNEADQAIVIVGEEHTRSKTMEAALLHAIDNGGLRARQALLPSTASPRLDTVRLPVIELTKPESIGSIIHHRNQHSLRVLHATDRNAAKLLMTPMRDGTVAGPNLREAHHRVGRYLAIEFVTDIVGLEEHAILHVQGHSTSGFRLRHEKKTSIVALMRGGEPMALGVNDAFPLAMFVHANSANDIKLHHLQGQLTVLLVDSVVNSGKSVVEFVQHIRNIRPTIRIVVVTGVVQAQSISGGKLNTLARDAELSLVALRLSDNKFTGSGTTDTGNRLFNTTHLA